MHDYLEEIDPSLVEVLEWAGNDGGKGAKEEATEDSLRTTTAEMSADAREQWASRTKVYKLLKRKTLATSEANKIVKCGERQNG